MPLFKRMNQLTLTDLYNSNLFKLYYKLYRNKLPIYFECFLPSYGNSRYPLRYDGLHMPPAKREFCELNAKYQLHSLLRNITHPQISNSRRYPSRDGDPLIEQLILSSTQYQFSRHIKRTFIEAYPIHCDLIHCHNNCNQ